MMLQRLYDHVFLYMWLFCDFAKIDIKFLQRLLMRMRLGVVVMTDNVICSASA